MIQDKRLKDYVESQNLNEDDLERLYGILEEIKNEQPDLSEGAQLLEAFEQLIFETSSAAEGMRSMAKSMNRDKKLKDLGFD